MSDYRIRSGASVALGSLNVFVPQPYSDGIKATHRDFSGDGTNYIDQGLYVELVWPLLPSVATYHTILHTCDLDVYPITLVTVYCRDDLYNYHRYNGSAIRPPAQWGPYMLRNVVLLVRDLEFID